jgi:hypothetical protein
MIILNAKEELNIIKQDLENLELKRYDTFKEYEQSNTRTQKLKENIAKKLSTHDQKEILKLLCNNFEFEMKNLEVQANLFTRDFQIREKEMIILRLEQHRSLCDMLIQQQRRLILEQNLPISKDLDELYFLYSRDIREGQLMKDISELNNNNFNGMNKNSEQTNKSLIKIAEEDSIFNEITSINSEEKQNDIIFPSPWSKRNFVSTLDRSYSDNKVFYKTNKNLQNNKKDSKRDGYKNKLTSNQNATNTSNINSMPHFAFNKKVKDSKNNMSMLSTGTNDSNIEILIENNGIEKTNIVHEFEQFDNNNNNQNRTNKKMKKHTQGIAAVAAQKKASQHHRDLMQEFIKSDEFNNESPTRNSNENNLKQTILHDGNSKKIEKYNEKKQSISSETTQKIKKQVKIKENSENKIVSLLKSIWVT